MLKPFSLIFFIMVMAWIGAIFISSDPQVRMDRTCVPVEYMDKAGTGGMQLVDPTWGQATHKFFENMQYGCRFVVWRMFYEEDWKRAQQTQVQPATAPASAPSSTPSGGAARPSSTRN